MKNFIVLIQVLLFASVANSQEVKSINFDKYSFDIVEDLSLTDVFLDPEFQQGTITLKSGNRSAGSLNYNIVTNGINFLNEKNEPLILVDIPNVLLITYGNRTFIPLNANEVAEVVKTFTNGSSVLLIRRAKLKNSLENRGPYGATVDPSSLAKISSLYEDGVFLNKKSNFEVSVTVDYNYFVVLNNKRTQIKRFKDLRKLYPSKWEDVKTFVLDNNIDLSKKEGLLSVLQFCNQ
jgi:hypothetical protein